MEEVIFFLKKHSKDIVFSLLLCLIAGFSVYSFLNPQVSTETADLLAVNEEVLEEAEISNEEEESGSIYVDVKGAIATPGVYELPSGSIVADAIELAGGFLANAYQDGINLSKKLSDEMVIYVYTKSEVTSNNKTTTSVNTSTNTCSVTSYDINDCVSQTESIITVAEGAAKNDSTDTETDTEETLVNINTASQSELETLSGIGEVKAKAIIEYRQSNGNFNSIEEIKNVSGIGDALFAKIKDYITV